MKKFLCFSMSVLLFFSSFSQEKTHRKKELLPDIERIATKNRVSKNKGVFSRTAIPKHGEIIKKQDSEMHNKGIKNMYNIQFKRDIEIGSGVETNGFFFFVSQWNSDTIYTYDINGTPSVKFTIPIVGIRDMAYDGTYFYGSNVSNIIYKMDFTNYAVVDSIICPSHVRIRHIAYDNASNAFWVGDWDSDMYLINHNGQVLNSILATTHKLDGIYGSAFDNITPGGPYLWVFDQGGNGCDIVMIHIPTGKQTGIVRDCTEDVASDLLDPIAGGLFIKSGLVPGTVTLGGIIQRQRIFGYDLSSMVVNNDIGIEGVLSPILHTGCNLTNSEHISLRIRNYGLNNASNFSVHMNFNNTPYTINVPTTLNKFETIDVTFPGTFNFSQADIYKMQFYTSYTYDNNLSNDTGYYYLITGNGLITVDVLTDDYPEETYWELYNNYTYDVYGSSYGYKMDANTLYSSDLCIDTTQCYGFTIYDFYGDGIFSPGYFEIFFNDNSVIYNDSFSSLFIEVPYIGPCDYADIGVTDVITPLSSCFLSDEEFISVKIKNFGTQTINNAQIAYSINNTTYTEPLPFALNSQEEGTYTFVNIADLSAFNTYEIKVFTVLNGDKNAINDTIHHIAENYFPSTMPYSLNFDDPIANSKILIEDENNDFFSWYLYNAGGMNNSSSAIYTFNPNEPANDWLFTKCIEFIAGKQYVLTFFYKAEAANYPEKLKVHLSKAPFSFATYTEPLINLANITNSSYALASIPFTVDTLGTGYYYLGFNVYSDLNGWNLYLDDISVSGPADINTPDKITHKVFTYPNPAKEFITIEFSSEIDEKDNAYTLFDMQGRKVLKSQLKSTKTNIDLNNLKQGVYILKIETSKEVFIKKIIKA